MLENFALIKKKIFYKNSTVYFVTNPLRLCEQKKHNAKTKKTQITKSNNS
jgi:hypothetical protein